MARYLSVVLAVGALLATAGYAGDPDCFQYSNCMNCTEAPSGQCGWDAASGTCKHGAAGGPLGASSSDASVAWWWTSNQCCESQVGCTDCTFNTGGYCGWAVNRNQCLFGNSWGPAVGNSESWVSNYLGCPSQCQLNNDCSSCVNQQGCGWLDATQQCVAGSSSGAFYGQPAVEDNYSSLNSGSAWYFSSCPSNWRLRWSANSYSLWCIVGGVGALLLGASVVAGRRRRRIIRQQRSQMAAYAAQVQPTVGAPLLAQAGDIQQPYTAQPIYGQPAPMPYYGATPEEGSCNGGAKTVY